MPISARSFVRSQLIFFVLGVVALVTVAGVALWLGERSSSLSQQTLSARDLKAEVVLLRAAVQRAESSQRGFLHTGNEIYLAPYDVAVAEARRTQAALPSLLTSYPRLAPVMEKLNAVLEDKYDEMAKGIALTRAGESAAALDLMLTNRGKALMDEATVYLVAISREADRRLDSSVAEQTSNTDWQRLVSVAGALIAVFAAASALVTILRYGAELVTARDALSQVNSQLEEKVAARTADLVSRTEEMRVAKERAEALMHEVNHRVANSLAMVSSLVGLQANTVDDEATKSAFAETQSRIQAVALVHQRLYSSGDVTTVALDDYLRSVLEQFRSVIGVASRISLNYHLDKVMLTTDHSINLGVIATEWVMNATKYAYPENSGEVRVTLSRVDGAQAVLSVEDDGVGRGGGPAKGTGLGTRIVTAMAKSLNGKVEYLDRHPGHTARVAFPLIAA